MRLIVATQPLPHNVAHMLDERQVRRDSERPMRYYPLTGTWRRHLAATASGAANNPPTPQKQKTPELVAQSGAESRERTSDDATHYTTVR